MDAGKEKLRAVHGVKDLAGCLQQAPYGLGRSFYEDPHELYQGLNSCVRLIDYTNRGLPIDRYNLLRPACVVQESPL